MQCPIFIPGFFTATAIYASPCCKVDWESEEELPFSDPCCCQHPQVHGALHIIIFFLGVISYKFFEIHLLDWGPKCRSSKVFTPNIVLTTVGPSAHGQKKSHPTKSQLDDCTTLYSYSWSLDFVDLLLQIIVLGNGFQQLFLKRLQLFVLGMTWMTRITGLKGTIHNT